MALKLSSVDVWAGDLNDVPGGLADVLERVSAGGGNVEFLIARRSDKHPGAGKVFITPVTAARTKDAASRSGLQHATKLGTLRVEGTDAKGFGAKMTRAMANAGINVRGVSAAVIGSRFVAYIGLDSPEDADRAARALKGVRSSAASKSQKRSGSRRKTTKKTTKKKTKRIR